MENQTLSIQQMQHLKELGVDTGKASMFYVPKLEPKNEYCLLNVKPNPVIPFIPAFTLHDIIELLLITAYEHTLCYKLHITRFKTIWRVEYGNGDICVKDYESESLLDAAYQMLCWCAENGYLKGGEK